MVFSTNAILKPWFQLLALPRQTSKTWHIIRLAEEKREFLAATTPLERLSEESDHFFTIGRATHDGYNIGEQPAFAASWRNALVYTYMFGKFSSRCAFYQMAAVLCRAGAGRWRPAREVMNPSRQFEVRTIAERHGICPDRFESIGHIIGDTAPGKSELLSFGQE
ncbi:hypothetical protein DL95DRAFT_452756 [Leptodontidium sp. 2 PMI_412]|nr:hypothetical protein DL95DRAFT_452756 [Leptodontidium sp. 2 PMI_412]